MGFLTGEERRRGFLFLPPSSLLSFTPVLEFLSLSYHCTTSSSTACVHTKIPLIFFT